MASIDFDKLTRSQTDAFDFLWAHCLQGKMPACPRCKGIKLYQLSDQRQRCAKCRYTFSTFAGRWINIGGLNPLEWLVLIQEFARGSSVQKIQSKLGVVYSTAYKAVTTLRRSIAAHSVDNHLLIPWIACEDPANHPPEQPIILGIKSPEDLFHLHFVTDVPIQAILEAQIRHVHYTFAIHTDPFAGYYALLYYIPHKEIPDRGNNIKLWEEHPDVWNFFLPWRRRKRRTTACQYILFAKEMEFRYDFRNSDPAETLVRYLCDFMPSGT